VTATDFERQLDVLSGIDAWQIVSDAGIRGISSRIQWVEPGDGWATFTIRKSRANGARTEWEKRVAPINPADGFIRPALIVHAYVHRPRRQGALEYACMCRCDDLFQFASEERRADEYDFDSNPYAAWYEKTNPQDGNTFAVFPVQRLRRLGVKVRTWDLSQQRELPLMVFPGGSLTETGTTTAPV
jgi:hypothetical protein